MAVWSSVMRAPGAMPLYGSWDQDNLPSRPHRVAQRTRGPRGSAEGRGHARISPRRVHRRPVGAGVGRGDGRSEEHTSELQSLMRSAYAVFSLQKKNNKTLHISHVIL